MVTFRGITVSMISQHGVRQLPEYEHLASADPTHNDAPNLRLENDSAASCYVPSYPGSQIWFDYSIENPHPPNAQYFFKLLHNNQVFTSWDCTAKYNYQGRTTFALKYLGTHPQTGQPVIERQAFRFSTKLRSRVGPKEDCVEIRVHRIEHRVRIPIEPANITGDDVVPGKNVYHDGLQLVNGGALATNDPKRHYKYQLVDPVDRPYATIRFYYRPLEYLVAIGIAVSQKAFSRQNSATSKSSRAYSKSCSSASRDVSRASSTRSSRPSEDSITTGSSRPGNAPVDSVSAWLHHHRLQKYAAVLAPISFDTLVTLSDADFEGIGVMAKGSRGKLLRELAAYKQEHLCHLGRVDSNHVEEKKASTTTNQSKASKGECFDCCLKRSGSDTPLHIITKESIEDLAPPEPPNISLSASAQQALISVEDAPTRTLSPIRHSAPSEEPVFSDEEIQPRQQTTAHQFDQPAEPVKLSIDGKQAKQPVCPARSPKKNPKSLSVQIHGATFELEEKEKRPLSPFTSGGMLRRLLQPNPASAPAKMTAFGPAIDEESGVAVSETEPSSKKKITIKRTTREERGGGLLSKLLSKRIGRG